MSGKEKTVFVCQGCGHVSPKWLGRCPGCDAWNTLLEQRRPGRRPSGAGVSEGEGPLPLEEVAASSEERIPVGIGELDRVLGGGIVPGSVVLIGGDPGIGKSTIMLQAMGSLARGGRKVLYVTGEESLSQIRLRASRLSLLTSGLLVYAGTTVEGILDAARDASAGVLVVDSIQTVRSEEAGSAGSLGQLREATAHLAEYAKASGAAVFLVGHVTKEGFIAGPKVLEHMVDTVLYFEGQRNRHFRILRAVKNRFGSVMEIGIFEMAGRGLVEVANPSQVFLAERPPEASGSAVVPAMEGTRSVLVEVQSLLCPAIFGVPRRTIVGIDYARVMLLAAVLEKKAGLALANHDIFIKVAGGMRIDDPAADLSVIASIASNFLERPIDQATVVFGEVGLAGEVRAVHQAGRRAAESGKLGFTRCILPADNMKGLKGKAGMEFVGVSSVKEAMAALFPESAGKARLIE